MWWTELRGIIAVALVAAAIAFAWNRIEARPIDPPEVTSVATTTTTTETTTTLFDQDVANREICALAEDFAVEGEAVGAVFGEGAVARLAVDFWRSVEQLAAPQVRAEVAAVVNYYEDYLETTEPFDFDYRRIIAEGDKEKLQQLLTRPAPGLEGSRALISLCGVIVADQPSMPIDEFEDLEDEVDDATGDDP